MRRGQRYVCKFSFFIMLSHDAPPLSKGRLWRSIPTVLWTLTLHSPTGFVAGRARHQLAYNLRCYRIEMD